MFKYKRVNPEHPKESPCHLLKWRDIMLSTTGLDQSQGITAGCNEMRWTSATDLATKGIPAALAWCFFTNQLPLSLGHGHPH